MQRLSVAVGQSPLAAEHERLLKHALRRGDRTLSRHDFAAIDGYSEQAMLGARSLWRRRMIQEHHSAAVWARLLPQLIAAGASLDFKTMALKAGLDELHHAALCGEVLLALGDEPEAKTSLETKPLPEHRDCSPLERALRNMLYVGCLAETFAVAVTAEERLNAKEPFIREVLDQVHADETLHGRIGWIFIAEHLPRLNDAGKARIDAYLPVAFAHLEQDLLSAISESPPPPPELHAEIQALGVSENNEARTLFFQTVEHVLIPGLEDFGLAATKAWQSRT
jgi:hypothetical protein